MKRCVLGCGLAISTLVWLAGCDSSSAPQDRSLVEVHLGSAPLVLDAREILTANGDFTLTAEAEGGTIDVIGEMVTFTPDETLGYGEVVLTGSSPAGDSVQAVVDIYYAPSTFRFNGVIDGLPPEPYADLMTGYSGATVADRFGDGLFEAGDWNDDGYDDVVVTASRANRPLVDQGAIYLLEGGPNGLTGPFLMLEGAEVDELMGNRALGGDLDGDAKTDLVYRTRPIDEAQRYTFVWGGSEQNIVKQEVELPNQEIAFVADLDGDGRAEIGVRPSSGFDDWTVYRGTGRASVATEVAFTLDGCEDGAPDVAVLGDADPSHEGSEIAVGCSGATHIISGSSGELIASYDGDLRPIAGLGDLDGDGIPEVVTAPWGGGTAYVQFGGLDAVEGGECNDTRRPLPSGSILARLKDIDRDGIDDLLYSRGASPFNTGWETGLWLSSSAVCPEAVGPNEPLEVPDYPVFSNGIRSALSIDIDDDGELELVLGVLGGPGHVVAFDMP